MKKAANIDQEDFVSGVFGRLEQQHKSVESWRQVGPDREPTQLVDKSMCDWREL